MQDEVTNEDWGDGDQYGGVNGDETVLHLWIERE